jgi:hypothetical protein
MKTPGQLFLEGMQVKFENMSIEEFNERVNSIATDEPERKIIKVFPDHCSSGFWDYETGIMIDEDELNLPDSLLIAYKYWHHVWEYLIDDVGEPPRMNKSYIEQWHKDGETLVCEMNKVQSEYEYRYCRFD